LQKKLTQARGISAYKQTRVYIVSRKTCFHAMTVAVCNRTSTMIVWFWKHICNINHWLAYLKLLYLLFHSKSQNIKQLLYACVRACTMKSHVVDEFWICFCQLSIRIFLIRLYIHETLRIILFNKTICFVITGTSLWECSCLFKVSLFLSIQNISNENSL